MTESEAVVTDLFIEQQARAWSEIREWAQEAEGNRLIPTKPGGSWDGPGASLGCTEGLREALPRLFSKLEIRTMLDAACGDWNWMRLVDLNDISYTGWDVDPGRILRCQQRVGQGDVTGNPHARFQATNLLTVEEVPRYDLILCRDFLGHLTNGLISRVLRRFRESGSKWLLATTYPHANNQFTYDPNKYAWLGYMERPVNLTAPPFVLTQKDALKEDPGPGGVLTEIRELALFQL